MLLNRFLDIKYNKLGKVRVGGKRGGERLTMVQVIEEEYKDPSVAPWHTVSFSEVTKIKYFCNIKLN